MLSAGQLATLPHPAPWLRIAVTTRLGPERLSKSAKQLVAVPVDALEEDDALALIREHLPDQRFASAADEAAARDIVRALGGFTLAVEQAAVYLGLNAADESPVTYWKRLQAEGLTSVDDLPKDAAVAAQMLHQQQQLGPILRATLEPLFQEIPAARTALAYACLLPPDTVPWPWLKELTLRHHPELADRPVAWGQLRRRLEGLRLLTGGDEAEIARVHRLVAAHLRKGVDLTLQEELNAYTADRAYSIQQSQESPVPWELESLLSIIPFLLNLKRDRDVAVQGTFLTEKVIPYRGLAPAAALLNYTHLVIRQLASSDPGNAAWQRDLSVSLNKLGDLAVAQGNLPEALRLYAESLRIRQQLAASDPGNAAWQRDLSYSLTVIAQVLLRHERWREALPLLEQSLTIDERLAASDPTNVTWQKDVQVSRRLVAQVHDLLGG